MKKIIQISCVPVPNVETIQCHVYMYALCEDGSVWFKRDNNNIWSKESLRGE